MEEIYEPKIDSIWKVFKKTGKDFGVEAVGYLERSDLLLGHAFTRR